MVNLTWQERAAEEIGVDASFHQDDSATVNLVERDMTFIDTWHVYAHLKRELAKHAPLTNKYLVLHDTTVDGEVGETVRIGWDLNQQSAWSGYPPDEIAKGLWQAIEEFLMTRSEEWELVYRFHNNNGLTVLRRRGLIS
jgi:cephalosporin hydroxylase